MIWDYTVRTGSSAGKPDDYDKGNRNSMDIARLKDKFTASSGEVMAALLLIQPLLDVLSYFMREHGDTAVTTVLRTVLLFVVCAYGFVIAENRRPYYVLYGVIGGFWLAHALNCLRAGYLDPVADAAEYLKLVQFPLWTLVFVSIFRSGQGLELRAVGLLAANFALILVMIGLAYATGTQAYTYDIPARGVKLGVLGWFAIPNAQSAILAMLLPGLLLWGYHVERIWAFAAVCGLGFALLFLTGTRLTYYAAILVGLGFLVLILLTGGRQRIFCIPLAVGVALLVLCRGISPMEQRQALTADSYERYQTPTDAILGEDKDYAYTGEEPSPELMDKLRRVYLEVYGGEDIAGNPLLTDLLERFGTERVMSAYRYATKASTLYNVRTKKLKMMDLVWEEQDALTRTLGVEYARAKVNGTNYDPENDFPAVLYFYGYLGFGLYGCFVGYFMLEVLAGCVRNWRRLPGFLTVGLGAWTMIFVLGMGAAQFSGQVLRKPSAMVYMSLAAAELYRMTHNGGKLFARYERRPGVTMKKL